MKKMLLILVFLQTVLLSNHLDLLSRPDYVEKNDIEVMQQQWSANFVHQESGSKISLSYDKGDVFLSCDISNSSYKKLPVFMKKYFHKFSEERYVYSVGNSNEKVNTNESYYYAHIRNLSNIENVPQKISYENLKKNIKQKNIVLYTGAGISAEKGLAMSDLNKVLLFSSNFESWLYSLLLQADEILQGFSYFCKRAFEVEGTKAHYALSKLACCKQCAIITENFDYLHEQSGVRPIHLDASGVFFDESQWKDIDMVICLGLSHDDRGLLGLYKEKNPEGIILALDLLVPSYLGVEDYFYQCDLQKVLPNLVSDLEI